MTADQYLTNILIREAVDTSPYSHVRGVIATLTPFIKGWAAQYLLDITASGSFAKGTANKNGTDLDIFISLSQSNPHTLGATYENLFHFLINNGYQPKRQNVSININVSGYSVDLVPGQRQNNYTSDHSLWLHKTKTWTKTNVNAHIQYVCSAGRINETRIVKLWRNQNKLDFPSFYVEMTVIEALRGYSGTLSQNVWRVFQYLQTTFETARVVDLANTNNVISDNLTIADKRKIKLAALNIKKWEDVVK